MKYLEIRDQKNKDTNKLFDTLGVFWAFSNKQFEEGKKKSPLQPNEKYIDIGAGGFMQKHNYQTLLEGMEKIDNTFKAQIKEHKAREAYILYELNNYECFYIGGIDPALEALGSDYTKEEVQEVWKKYRSKKYARPTIKSDYILQDEAGTIHKITEKQADNISNNKQDQYE